MNIARKRYGTASEQAAKEWLIGQGYEFIDANISTRYGEIDLLMRNGTVLVGVEVKARHGQSAGHPAEAVTPRKLQHLTASLQQIILDCRHTGPWRIDVVAISGNRLEHLRNVTS